MCVQVMAEGWDPRKGQLVIEFEKRKYAAVAKADFLQMMKQSAACMEIGNTELGREFQWNDIADRFGFDHPTIVMLNNSITLCTHQKPNLLLPKVDTQGKTHLTLTYRTINKTTKVLIWPSEMINLLAWLLMPKNGTGGVTSVTSDHADEVVLQSMDDCIDADGVPKTLSVAVIKGEVEDISTLVRVIC